jgi:hypothetical protein
MNPTSATSRDYPKFSQATAMPSTSFLYVNNSAVCQRPEDWQIKTTSSYSNLELSPARLGKKNPNRGSN